MEAIRVGEPKRKHNGSYCLASVAAEQFYGPLVLIRNTLVLQTRVDGAVPSRSTKSKPAQGRVAKALLVNNRSTKFFVLSSLPTEQEWSLH